MDSRGTPTSPKKSLSCVPTMPTPAAQLNPIMTGTLIKSLTHVNCSAPIAIWTSPVTHASAMWMRVNSPEKGAALVMPDTMASMRSAVGATGPGATCDDDVHSP